MGLEQIAFIVISLLALGLAGRAFLKIKNTIALGKEVALEKNPAERWKNTILVALGQKKMFKRWIPAIFHLFIYVAFLFTSLELIEIFIDGFTGQHRALAPMLGGFYTFIISLIEILSVLALIATVIFLWRRNLLKVPRLVKSEMDGWPTLDANIILILEIFLVCAVFLMNGTDIVLQGLDDPHYVKTGNFAITSWLGPMLFGSLDQSTLVVLERVGWWMHILTVFAFLNYLPISKHLHIFLAFPNVYFSRLSSRGEIENMPAIMNEVKSMMGLIPETEASMDEELPEFGAKDIFDLNWTNIMNAYACTECGRCTDVCPANSTGKKLSPRKIMMDIRDRATEVKANLESNDDQYKLDADKALDSTNYTDGKSLFDYISKEEIHACTTCNACVEACPIMINPLDPILALRRYEILTESAGPSEWLPMFTSVENSGSVWQVPNTREDWITS